MKHLNINKAKLLCLIYVFLSNFCYSQNFIWTKQFGGHKPELNPNAQLLDDGSSIFSFQMYDTGKIGNLNINLNHNTHNAAVVKLDKNGNPLWVWKPDSAFYFQIFSIKISKKTNSIYILGRFDKMITLGSIKYKTFNRINQYILIKLDSNGVLLSSIASSSTCNLYIKELHIDINENIYLPINFNYLDLTLGDSVKLFNKTINIDNIRCGFIFKVDSYFNFIKFSNPIYGISEINIIINKNKLKGYINFNDSCIYNQNVYKNGKYKVKSYALEFDNDLELTKLLFLISHKSWNGISDFSILANGDILFVGELNDSIQIKNDIYLINNQALSKDRTPLLACFDSLYKINWIKKYQIKYESNYISGFSIQKVINDGENFFISGFFNQGITFDDFKTSSDDGRVTILKLDSRGNTLWIRRMIKTFYLSLINTICYNKNKEILFGAYFIDTLKINNQTFISNGNNYDLLFTKIQDIEIFRGQVSSGPYCAGDTISIPYTIAGHYNIGNEFIAQLSDENGNFDDKYRELGRLKSINNGIIKATLPLFNVESSKHYRIRIISTNPPVQSYYKYDTLRLLIYSKDTAFAGIDTTICAGNSILLSTTGGTRFSWSPQNTIQNPNSKSTWATPTITTKYRIIISDSSGCGITDTAYKTVNVLNPLNIVDKPKNEFCKSKPILLKAEANGGNGNYIFKWLNINNEVLSNFDSLKIIPSQNDSIKLIVSDGCTLPNDTSWYYYNIPKALQLNVESYPLCANRDITISASHTGGLYNFATYQWFDTKQKLISHDPFLQLDSLTNTSTYFVKATDPCGISISKSIKLLMPIKIKLTNAKDSFCENDETQLKCLILKNTKIRNLDLIINSIPKNYTGLDTLIKGKQTGWNSIIGVALDSSNCTDTSKVHFYVEKLPNADIISDPEILSPNLLGFSIKTKNPENAFHNYNINWKSGNYVSKNKNVYVGIIDTGKYEVSYITKNTFGCSSQIFKTFWVLPNQTYYIPNTFTPNGDGINDVFEPYGWFIDHYELTIIGRNKQIVHKSSSAWAPEFGFMGAYSYLIKLTFKDKTVKEIIGTVIVMQ